MLDYTVNINRINKWIFSKMKESEKSKYDKNLNLYSEIVKKRILSIDTIIECMEIFEYFEDYEKCDHLLHILKEMEQNKNSKIGKETR